MTEQIRISVVKRWLSLTEAAMYANVGKRMVRKMVDEGKIKGAQSPDKKNEAWVIDRLSIDEYYEGLCDPTGFDKEAATILKSLK